MKSQVLKKAGLLLVLLATGCSSLQVDDSYRAQAVDSRIQFVVLHYTAASAAESLRLLTGEGVSSHYLIDGAKIYRLADEHLRTAHAGNSQWQGRTWLNASSIGIEMVHPGHLGTAAQPQWVAWDSHTLNSLIALLHDIRARHGIAAGNIVGHADVAPQRKVDPGPLFPWFRLAREGLIPWPLHRDINDKLVQYEQALPDISWFQQQLLRAGYAIEPSGQLDEQTRRVLAVVQMKYRPRLHQGEPDAETAAILHALIKQLESGD